MANSPKLSGKHDLPVILALTALLIVCIVFISSNIPRIILGLPFILFFPGYTLMAALCPRKGSLSGIERVALSLGLSVAVVPLIGLLLNYIWEISLYPILISISAFVAVMCVLTYFRRRQLPPQERFEPQINLQIPQWGKQSRLDRALTVLLAVVAIGAIVTVVYVGARPKPGEKFTEFYLLGLGGTAEHYPHDVILGVDADVIVGVINHEGEEITYRVRVSIDGTEMQAMKGISIHDGEKWEDTVTLTPTKAGDNQKVEFLLYKAGESDPYHELHLWINVRSP